MNFVDQLRGRSHYALLAGALLLAASGVAAEPYAPVFQVPEGAERAEFQRMQQQRVAGMIPDRAAVNVPPYPGSVVFLVHPEEQVVQMIGRGGLAEIKLLTPDSEAQIVAFYSEQLPDWNLEEEYSIFWYGEGEFGLARLMEGMPNITINPAGSMAQQVVPDAAHMISIVYRTDGTD